MRLGFDTGKLAKVFNSEKDLKRKYGERAIKIMRRMKTLEAAECLAEVPTERPDRCHQLTGDRAGQFAVDVDHPYRLVFAPEPPVPTKEEDGGIDLRKVKSIIILGVEDCHG